MREGARGIKTLVTGESRLGSRELPLVKGEGQQACPSGSHHAAKQAFYGLLRVKWPRRFCCQQDSVCSVQNCFSLPQLVVLRLVAGIPRLMRYSLTALARRWPRARLYSVEPRSSQ